MSRSEHRIGDDFYLITHDDRTGRLQVPPDAARFGLATAMIGELVLSGHLGVHEDGLYPIPSAAWPDNDLACEVLRTVSDPRQERHIGMWIRFLAVEAVADVRRRLVADGVLREEVQRRVLGHKVTYPPVSSNDAAWAAMRLARSLSYHEPMAPPDTALTGIVIATGLLDIVLWDPVTHGPGKKYADQVRCGLPPPLSALAAHTTAAVADSVLTHTR